VLEIEKKKVTCPFCGHEQKVQYTLDARCKGVFIKCQARHCKKEFEIKINQDK
jgi:transcription elongation factor Elf1